MVPVNFGSGRRPEVQFIHTWPNAGERRGGLPGWYQRGWVSLTVEGFWSEHTPMRGWR